MPQNQMQMQRQPPEDGGSMFYLYCRAERPDIWCDTPDHARPRPTTTGPTAPLLSPLTARRRCDEHRYPVSAMNGDAQANGLIGAWLNAPLAKDVFKTRLDEGMAKASSVRAAAGRWVAPTVAHEIQNQLPLRLQDGERGHYRRRRRVPSRAEGHAGLQGHGQGGVDRSGKEGPRRVSGHRQVAKHASSYHACV